MLIIWRYLVFFDQVNRSLPIIDRSTFLFPLEDEVTQERKTLQYAVWAHAAELSSQDKAQSREYYLRAREGLLRFSVDFKIGPSAIYILQTASLIALYELKRGMFATAAINGKDPGSTHVSTIMSSHILLRTFTFRTCVHRSFAPICSTCLQWRLEY